MTPRRPTTDDPTQRAANALRGPLRLLAMLELATALLLAGLVVAAWSHAPPPRGIVATASGRLLSNRPLDRPLPQARVVYLALRAAKAVSTYDYQNYAFQIGTAESMFTPTSWSTFLTHLEHSGILNDVVQNREVVTLNITGAPSVPKEGLTSSGAYGWMVRFPATLHQDRNLLTAAGVPAPPVTHDGIMTVYVVRVPESERPSGLAIDAIDWQPGAVR